MRRLTQRERAALAPGAWIAGLLLASVFSLVLGHVYGEEPQPKEQQGQDCDCPAPPKNPVLGRQHTANGRAHEQQRADAKRPSKQPADYAQVEERLGERLQGHPAKQGEK